MSSEHTFENRVAELPHLGLGISTEFGAGRTGLDVNRLAEENPDLVRFLEVGADLERGVDDDVREWVAASRPTTYHFLDANLEEPESIESGWIEATTALAKEIGAAWLCGDAGLWYVGVRDRGHGTLMPPVLTRESAESMAESVRRIRVESGFEVLPENPPAHVFAGELHILEYFARVAEGADCGLLLDVAHLAIHQRARDLAPTDGLDDFPLDRIVECHVAAGTPFVFQGRTFIDDDHGPDVLAETWTILEAVLERAPNVRALVFECERNRPERVLPTFRRLQELFAASPSGR